MTDHQAPADAAPSGDVSPGDSGAPPHSGAPDYGPGGYLPERAARRARKIVLRAPMGLQWPLAAALAAVAVLVLGVVYLGTRTGPPGAPFIEAAMLEAIDPRGAAVVSVAGEPVLVVRGAGGLNAFAAPAADVEYCRESRRIEAADGRVWLPDGRLVGGDGRSLAPHPVRVHDGTIYVDPQPDAPPPEVAGGVEQPSCFPSPT